MTRISVEQLREEIRQRRDQVRRLETSLLRETGWNWATTPTGEWRWANPDFQRGITISREAAVRVAMGEQEA